MKKRFFYGVLVFFLLTFVSVASADTHTSSADLQPEWSPAGQNVDYTVTISNDGPDPVDEVRIYRNMQYTNFQCDAKPGWEYNFIVAKQACQYIAENSSYYILAGDNDSFTFSATTPSSGCEWVWEFESRDVTYPATGWIQFLNDTTSVDDLAPNMTKTVSGPQSGVCPPGVGGVCWITQSTVIDVSVVEQGDCGISGLDFCRITYTVDGGVPVLEVYAELDGESSWNYSMSFVEDSVHVLNVTCYDIAGNVLEDIETFRVDSIPPETNKSYGVPYYPLDINAGASYPHWINSSSLVTLDPVDGGDVCAIGVDKTWYIDVIVSDVYCEGDCVPVCETSYNHECIQHVQDMCVDWDSMNYSSWAECVEDEAYEVCEFSCRGFGDSPIMWNLYTGPFLKENESCHVIQFYSVDVLGNLESMNTQCVFVDNTPPVGNKTVGDPSIPCDPDDPSNCSFWVQDHITEINLSCMDQMPHPVDHEIVCYRVSLDGSDVSGQYCDVSLDDGWCCVDAPKTIVFEEDSLHGLEFYCLDALGNAEESSDLEFFRVDSQPPIINKTVVGPQVGVCPPGPGDDCWIKDWMFENGTVVHVEAVDDNSSGCAVDLVECSWWYYLDGDYRDGDSKLTPPFDIKFFEDSVHELHVMCCDALGNCVDDNETFLVDSIPPETVKSYGLPYKALPDCVAFYESYCGGDCGNVSCWVADGFDSMDDCVLANVHLDCPQWISSQTPVNLSAVDNKVGVARIYWADNVVPDEACWDPGEFCHPVDSPYEMIESDSVVFYKSEESCHLIQFYSVDLLNNSEELKFQCVFVDNTPPVGNKTVGDPRLSCGMTGGGGAGPCGRMYTLNADFDEGVLSGVEHDTVADQLQLILGEVSTYPVMWIANSGDPSVSKWDTNTNKELARYQTFFGTLGSFGSHSGPAPSRTAVDVEGNMYVANRQFPNDKAADVLKILSDDYIDRNGNGVMDTSYDANDDGVISPSEMMPLIDNNSNGKIDDEEILDERIAWAVEVGPLTGLGRSLSIDLDGNLWVGMYNTGQYYKISGVDGSILAGPISTPGHTPYGSLVDKHGILWGASLSTNLLRLDTDTHDVKLFSHSAYGGNYGIALGYDSADNTIVYLGSYGGNTYIQFNSSSESFSIPAELKYTVRGVATDADGNIVAGSGGGVVSSGGVAKFASNGSLIWSAAPQVSSEARGTVIDSNNDVWLIHVSAHKISKFNGSDGSPLGVFDSGRYPYTYSDATGLGLRGAVSAGSWDVVFDSGVVNSSFNMVSWNSLVPEDTSVSVKVRSSDNMTLWSSWESAGNGVALNSTPEGRYLQVVVSMTSTTNVSPVLYDLSVDAFCGSVGFDCWWVRDLVTPISLDCVDPGDHPVEQETLCYKVSFDLDPDGFVTDEYCLEFGGVLEGDWCCAYVGEEPYTLYFMEDSVHDLEFYCMDHLGNAEKTTDLEYFRVDSTPPNTTKEYHGPYYMVNGTEYIDSASNISLSAVDGGVICHVDGVETFYRWGMVDDMACWNASLCGPMDLVPIDLGMLSVSSWIPYSGAFNISEESCHLIQYYSVDALGNTEDVRYQCVFVDKSPPVIVKNYSGPYFMEGGVEWISSETVVSLAAVDVDPHPSGLKELSYRISLVGDGNCSNQSACLDAVGSGGWTGVSNAMVDVSIGVESCHLIEVRAVDNVDKESLHKQCVFVDDTSPVPNKTVGDPKTTWDGLDSVFYPWIGARCWNGLGDEIECWRVTLATPISLECVDPLPHPVDHERVCFNVEVDALDDTSAYCSFYGGVFNASGDGFCCLDHVLDDFMFLEETEHNLEYYCVDALDNMGPVDEEKFKVEGVPFEIELNRKWNLISVPFMLLDDDIGVVLKDVEDSVEAVWTFDAEHQICGADWCVYTPDGNDLNDNLHRMIPGWGYWVLASEDDLLMIGGSEMKPAVTPPSRTLFEGWNLIGYHGTDDLPGYYGPVGAGDRAYCALYTLRNDWSIYPPTKWSALETYWEPDNPNQWKLFGVCDRLDPGAGYWVFMDADDVYARSTACPEGMVDDMCE